MNERMQALHLETDETEIDEKYLHIARQLDVLPPDKLDVPITVIGAGAIGSFTVFGLAKSGFESIRVFDDDDVSMENMSCSLYRRSDIGSRKVAALASIIEEFARLKIDPADRRFADNRTDEELEAADRRRVPAADVAPMGVTIVTVDSMRVRAAIWDVMKTLRHPTSWFFDARMSAQEALLYAVRPAVELDRKMYETTLYSDAEAAPDPCTNKATTFTALSLSGHIISVLKCVLTGDPEEYPRITQWSLKHSDQVVHKARISAVDG